MISSIIENLQSDIAILQYYIARRQATGFHDMERYLEAITIHIFKSAYDLNLSSKNQIQVNFPAIDLADDVKRVAVQVTTNADKPKIKKTKKTFLENKLELHKSYDTLYIFGFCNADTTVSDKKYIVVSIDTIVNVLIDLNDEERIQDVADQIRKHNNYEKLYPYQDKACLSIVLNCINRNAIKHKMVMEGSYSEMVRGLNQITELIATGKIDRKEKGKSIDNFQNSDIRIFLNFVKDEISKILAIVNMSTDENRQFTYLNWEAQNTIDQHKLNIAVAANNIADEYGLEIEINIV